MDWVLFGLWIFPLLDGVFRFPRWWQLKYLLFSPLLGLKAYYPGALPHLYCVEKHVFVRFWWTICCIALPSLAFLEQFTEFNLGKHDPKSNAVGVGLNHLVVCSNVW